MSPVGNLIVVSWQAGWQPLTSGAQGEQAGEEQTRPPTILLIHPPPMRGRCIL